MGTNDGFDLVAVLLDQLQWKKADGHHSAVLDDLAAVDLREGALAQKVALGVLVFSVLEVLHNKYSLNGEYKARSQVNEMNRIQNMGSFYVSSAQNIICNLKSRLIVKNIHLNRISAIIDHPSTNVHDLACSFGILPDLQQDHSTTCRYSRTVRPW